MDKRHLAAIAAILLTATAARADIEIANQSTVPIYVQLSNWAEPGAIVTAVVCATASVPRESTVTVARQAICSDKAIAAVEGPRRVNGDPARCSLANIAWSGGRMTVSGSLQALTCAQ